jgi:hypothetical protein
MTYKEEDWIDEEATSHRGPDEWNSQGMIGPIDNPDRSFRKVEAFKMRDPAAPSNFYRAQPRDMINLRDSTRLIAHRTGAVFVIPAAQRHSL